MPRGFWAFLALCTLAAVIRTGACPTGEAPLTWKLFVYRKNHHQCSCMIFSLESMLVLRAD